MGAETFPVAGVGEFCRVVPAGSPPTPPQTRTSTTNASGSSKRRIRSRRHMTTPEVKRTLGQKLPNVPIRGRSFSPMVPFATRRLPPIGYPTFKRYYETTTTATSVIPRASVPLAREFPRCSRYFARIGRGKLGPCARTLVSRCHPFPAVNCGNGAALPAFQDTPICLCPALSSRTGHATLGLHHQRVASDCVRYDAVPPYRNRKTRTR